MQVLFVSLLTIASVTLCHSALLRGSPQKELYVYKTQIQIVTDFLGSECPDYLMTKRESLDGLIEANIDAQKNLYQKLLKELVKCRERNAKQTATNSTATRTTTPTPATTPTSQPQECLSATNLTQSWRLEHNGADIRGGGPSTDGNGYACDFRSSNLSWFRFSGNAGNRMLNTCPKYRSCGTYNPLWTDAVAPEEVGMATSAMAYGAYISNCRRYKYSIEVMRCSRSPNDLIYRQVTYDYSNCADAFCGME